MTMTALKCKMCGSDLVAEPDSAVCECGHCGAKQTIPAANDEKKLALFEVAGRLRVHGEFEKASGLYEGILALYPEEAEAYWGLVLCKYGIEYTDDTNTGKKKPVCRRPASGSVLEDRNYKMACRYASPEAKKLYDDEARVIDKLPRVKPVKTNTHRKGLLIGVLAAAVVAVAAFVVVLVTLLMPNIRYQHAAALMKSGRYDEAIEAFEAMDGYRDSTAQIEACRYGAAVALMESGSYDEAIAAFEAMNGYEDSAEQIENCRTALKDIDYDAAVALMEAGEYTDAVAAFEAMDGYRDSAAMITEICHIPEYLRTLEVGDHLYFGNYGGEDVEWRVLDTTGDALLVISEYGLDAQPYNITYTVDVTWETCTLRSWLNNDFYNAAFSTNEQDMIKLTNIVTEGVYGLVLSDGVGYKGYIDGGNDTQDKVFLLSLDEAEQYFASDDDRMCIPTEYAMANGAGFNEKYSGKYGEIVNTCWWWVRSPGDGSDLAAAVDDVGSLLSNGYGVDYGYDCVRPAFWLNLDS